MSDTSDFSELFDANEGSDKPRRRKSNRALLIIAAVFVVLATASLVMAYDALNPPRAQQLRDDIATQLNGDIDFFRHYPVVNSYVTTEGFMESLPLIPHTGTEVLVVEADPRNIPGAAHSTDMCHVMVLRYADGNLVTHGLYSGEYDPAKPGVVSESTREEPANLLVSQQGETAPPKFSGLFEVAQRVAENCITQ